MVKVVKAPPNPNPIMNTYIKTNTKGEFIPKVGSKIVLISIITFEITVIAFPPYFVMPLPNITEAKSQDTDIGASVSPDTVALKPNMF